MLIINEGKLLCDAPLDELAKRGEERGLDLERTVLEIVQSGVADAQADAPADGQKESVA